MVKVGDLVLGNSKKLSQWFLKITYFAEDLIENLNELEGWPKKVLSMQKIG